MSMLLMAFLIGFQTQSPSHAASAADRFALDLPVDDSVTAPPQPVVAPVAAGGLSLDTPIGDLIADARAKAILDRDVPGLSEDENLPRFKVLSLRKLAPLSGGQMTPALLAKVGADLAAIDVTAPVANRVESRRALPSGR